MKQHFTFRSIIFSIALLAVLTGLYNRSFAEGTKELMPNSSVQSAYLQIWDQNDPTRKSMTFDSDPLFRMNIRICNIGEKVHIGFQQPDTNVYWRVIAPNGSTIISTQKVPKSGAAGYINNYSEAVAGPKAVVGASGYTSVSFTASMLGDYYIQFNPASPTTINRVKTTFPLFDISVEKNGAIVKGRLWTKAWDLQCNSGSNPFNSKLYIYSKDSVVTSLNFNGMQPFGFVISANSTGCTATGDINSDRKSRVGNVTYPEYPIFLNEPDSECFPTTASFGKLTGPITISGCDPNNRCINIPVDKAGKVEVLLDLELPKGFTPNSKDKIIGATLKAGNNCLTWNSRDGKGNLVPPGVIDVEVNYFNGLTHLPLYDVENHLNGYSVALVKPTSASAPSLYWDDTDISAGTSIDGKTNFSGCSVATGCHRWKDRGDNGCTTECPETINTWWYGATIKSTTQFTVSSIIVDANSINAANAVNDTTICSTTNSFPLHGLVSGFTTTGVWSGGTGTFTPSTSTLKATYTLGSADKQSSLFKLILESTGNGICPAVKDTLFVNVIPGPTAQITPVGPLCKSNPTASLTGVITVANSVQWTGGNGTFVSGRTTKTPTYKPTTNELNAGSVTLTLTTTNYPACPAASSNITLTYINGPTVSAGTDQIKCANNPIATLNGSTNSSTFNWTGGSGTFTPDRNTLNATYKPTQTEINAKSVKLTLNASQTGCTTTTSDVTITYSDAPTVNAGGDQSLCANNPNAALNATVTVATGGQWTGGNGTFTAGRNALINNTYKPTASEIASGVTLTLSTTNMGTCNAVSQNVKLSFTSSPTVDVGFTGGSTNVCGNNNNAQITLNPTKTGATGVFWSGGNGTFVPNNTAASATYSPTPAEISAGVAALIVETTGNLNNCNPAKDTLTIVITAAPTASAGTGKTVCANNPKVTLGGAVTGQSSFSWSGGTGTFTPANSQTPVYELSQNEINAGSVTLTLSASKSACATVISQVTISVSATPTIDSGADQSLCTNNATATLNGFVSTGTTPNWTGGLGTFTPDRNTLNATYKPIASEISSGVTLTLNGVKSGCTNVTKTVSLSFINAPTIDAGSPITVCSNNPTLTLTGTITPATTSVSWAGGNGTFSPGRSDINAKYTPTSTEINTGSLTLTLVSGNDNNCTPVQDQVQITINKAPTIDAGTSKTVCEDNPIVTLAGSISGGGTGIWSGGNGTFTPDNTNLTATYAPSNTEIQAGKVKLFLTSNSANGCNPQTDSMTITYNAAPTIDAGQTQTLCGSVSSVTLDGSFTVVTGGTWTHDGNGNLANPNSAKPTYTPASADKTKGFVKFTYTSPTNGSCAAVNDDVKVFFTSVPKINAGPKQTVCTNEYPILLNATGSPATWSGGNGTFSSLTDLNATYIPNSTEESAGSVTLTITTIPSGACPSVSSSVKIMILPKPVPNAGTDITTCGNTNSITLNGSISHSTNVFWSSDGNGSFSPNAGTLAATYVPTTSEKENGAVINIKLTSTPNSPCPSEEVGMVLKINPKVLVDAGPDQIICADKRTLTLNGTVDNGAIGTWSKVTGTGTITNPTSLSASYGITDADTTAKTVVLKLSSTATTGCPAISKNITFTITPIPKISAGSNITICSDSNFINLSGSLLNASTSEWTSTGNGTFSPDAFSLSPKYYFSSTDTALSSIGFSLKTVDAGTCNSVSSNMTATINKAPIVSAGPDQTVCSDVTSVDLSGKILHGSTGTWTTSGNGTFSPSATNLNAKYLPSTTDISKKIVTLTLTSSGPGSCKSISSKMIIRFSPAPTLDAGPNQIVCADEDSIKLNGTTTVATGGTWKSSGNGSFLPNANLLTAIYSPSASDTLAGAVTLTLTTTGMGTCNAISKDMVVTINKKPIVSAGSNLTICADSAFVQLSSAVLHAGGVKWSTSGTGSFFPNETSSNPKYVPSSTDTSAGSVQIRIKSTGNKSCSSAKDTIVITMTNAPTVDVGTDQEICAETKTINVAAKFTTATGGTWTTSGNGSFTPGAGGAATYQPSTSDKNVGSVVLTFTTTGNGDCKKVSSQLDLTIDPIPVVVAGHNQTICADVSEVSLNPTIQNATGGIWSKIGSGVFGPDETTLKAKYFPSTSDKTNKTVKLILTSTGNGLCSAISDTITLKISPAPTVDVGDAQTICSDSAGLDVSAQLTVATAGIWSSSHSSGTFTPNSTSKNATYIPSAADITAKSVILKFTTTDQGTCNAVSDSLVVTISPAPTVIAGTDIDACADFENIQLSGQVFNATSGKWTTDGNGTFIPDANSVNAIYSPSNSDKDNGNGSVTLTLTTTGIGSCIPKSSNLTIDFSPIPTADAGPDITVCTGTTSIPLNPVVSVAKNGKWLSSGNGTFIPDENTLNATYKPSADDQAFGSVILTLFTTDNGACNQVTSDLKVSFSAIPSVNAGTAQTVCETDLPIQLAGSGTTGVWSGGNGTFLPNNNTLNATYMPDFNEINAGTVTLTLTTTGIGGSCTPGTSSVTINITKGGPDVVAGNDINACANTTGITLAGSFTGASGVKWTTGSGTGTFIDNTNPTTTFKPSPQQIQAGVAHLTLTTTGAFGCKDRSDKMEIFISESPTVDAGSDQDICATSTTVQLNATKTVASGIKWTKVSGGGSFSNDISLSPTYNIVPSDTTAHSITLRATTTGNGTNCEAVSKDLVINFTSKPTISAGTNSSICADKTSIALDGKIIGATAATWTTNGTGTFTPNNVTLDASYIPSEDDKSGIVTLTLTPGGTGSCTAIPATRILTFITPPTLSAGHDTSICSDISQIALKGFVDHAGGVQWTSTGTGTFIGGTTANAIYQPSLTDKNNGGATLTITTTGSTPCAEIENSMALKILPAPKALVNAGLDQTVCRDVTSVKLSGAIFIAGGGKWSGGSGKFLPSDSTLDAEYIPSAQDKIAGTISLVLTTTNNGICAPNFDDMFITFSQGTSTDAGPGTVSVCADSSFITLTGSVNIALGVQWSTAGNGTFAPDEFSLNTKYYPAPEDRQNGSVGITITTTDNGTCNPSTDNLIVNFNKTPSAFAGTDKTVCSDATSVTLGGTLVSNNNGVTWTSSGNGTFTNPSSSNTFYKPSTADIAAKSIILKLKANGNGSCKPVNDEVNVNFTPLPTVSAGPDQTICADATSLALIGKVTEATGGVWSTTGSGIFSPDKGILSPAYKLSTNDKSATSITLTLKTTGGTCKTIQADKVITIRPTPVVSSGPAQICAFVNGASLTGTVNFASGGIWSSTGSGTFSPSPNTLNANYFPSTADIASGNVTLTLTSTGAGTCKPVSKSSILLVKPLPVADAGDDQYVCKNSAVTLVAKSETDVSYSWINSGGTSIGNTETTTLAVPNDTYIVLEVKDKTGCKTQDTVRLNIYDLPVVSIPNHSCLSDTLVLDGQPTNMPVVPGKFQWFRDNVILPGEDDFTLVVKKIGTHTLTWSYNNCSVSTSSNVTEPPFLLSVDTIIACTSGTANLTTASIPATGINYIWTQSGVTAGNTQTISTTAVSGLSTYYVKGTDGLGCFALDSIKLVGIPKPQFNLKDSVSCQNKTVVLDATPINITGLSAMHPVYKWKVNNNIESNTTNLFTANTSGEFIAFLTIDQCVGSDTANILLNPVPADQMASEIKNCFENTPTITLDAGTGTGLSYLWSTSNNINLALTQTLPVTGPDKYFVKITNAFKCTLADSVDVRNVCEPRVFFPNAFTPNGTGPSANEKYLINVSYLTKFNMTIFNRWGEIIFHTEDPNVSWDGTYRGEPMPVGVYPWTITYEGDGPEFGGVKKLDGSVTLIR